MYVFVRRDLSPTYRMVQGAHALAELAIEQPKVFKEWNNSTIVFLNAYSKEHLDDIKSELFKSSNIYDYWEEPDMDDETTSIVCYAPDDYFKGYKLA